ncbi:MAG: T9SS type A sorting domain-containing protein [Ignavibacteria bacterium]|nr:T9SS type A sorting domain-containing protein [Ignavibacteria bacterium]
MDPSSMIIMESGSKFCNRGGTINGGKISINGIIRTPCNAPNPCTDNYMKDSSLIILEEDSELEIPDSTTYIFEGNETALICKDSSTIKFGKGSKLIFKDGARISANNTKFMSYDSTEAWDGIYITGDSYDTLKNCTFENAENGVNIGSSGLRPGILTTTLITNCTFNNRTNTKFSNQVYVYGNNPTLISGCNTESDLSEGFSNAVLLEYCGAGYVVITDNNFDNISCGIAAIQSSPYIARNVITGPASNGAGISLDNSNGTIEYNKIYNFENSIYCLYSSPYLLKNTFSDADEINLHLSSYSAPILKPVTSGTITRWLGGNNLFTGTPNGSAFNFSGDCAPLMDSGYNVISVSEAYYISAEISGDFNATLNNWYDDPPDPDLFETSGGRIVYEPYFDGTSLPTTDYYELNSLGFGMYDSVYVKDLTETSTVDSYFMQAYMKEMEADYSSAIIKYKYVVSDFKTTSYAPVAIARIFACLEKANSSTGAFQQIQGYYSGINSDTGNTTTVRELAEDFMIKSKVKQGMIEEAISDYNAIYQANTGNSTGVHALLNKACLEHMLTFGDNMSGSTSGYSEHKAKLLSLLLGKEIKNNHISINNTIPGNFKLYQNYPNPFNPVTSIKYDIPKDNFVNVRIYDLLGREVFSSGEFKKAGSYEVKFDGTNFASGMYFYSLESGSFRETKKMVLIK